MKAYLLLPVLLITTVSCKTKPKPIAPKTDMETVQGKWVLAGFKTDPTAKGTLTLKPDSTFSAIMDSEKARSEGKQPKDNTFSGKFSLSRNAGPDGSTLFLDFSISTFSGKPAGAGMGFRLSYDPKHNVLTDLLIMYYARPEELEKVKAALAEARRTPKV
jgi:hypothetical protein